MTLFIPPVDNMKLTSKYDPQRIHPVLKIVRKHAGVDLINTKIAKAPIYAVAAGTVRLVKTTKDGYGKYIIISHNIGGHVYESVYAHLDAFSVKEGQTVKRGQKIAVMGNTGIGTGIHLHFELHRGEYRFDNYTYPNSFDPWPWIGEMKMKVSQAGLDLIKKWEGFYANAYLCPANVWTIGYGTTRWPNGNVVRKGEKITQAEATVLLEQQVNEHASAIFNYVKVELTQNQFDALASFCYNLGKHILGKDRSLADYINKRDWANTTRVMQLYNKGGGKVLAGLTNRRKDEVMLFSSKDTTNTTIKEDGVYGLANITSDALREETEYTLDSPARRELIISAAIAAGANEQVWRGKVANSTISEADYQALATKALIHSLTKHKK